MQYIIAISILILLLIYCYNDVQKTEHLETSEAIQTIADMYNNNKLIASNLMISNDATISGKLNVDNINSSKELNITGDVNVGSNIKIPNNKGLKFAPVCRTVTPSTVDMGDQNKIFYLDRVFNTNRIKCNDNEYFNGFGGYVGPGQLSYYCCTIGTPPS